MKTIKKLVVKGLWLACGWLVAAGLCGTAWAEPAAEADFAFDSATGTITGYNGAGGDVEIPATIGGVDVKAIREHAFYAKPATSVTIPAGVTNIMDLAFEWCHLTNVTFAAGSQLKNIGAKAFYRCGSLESVIFPAECSLETVGSSAFQETGLTSITIPASVTNIGDDAFLICRSLASVTFAPDSKLEAIGSRIFYHAGLTEITIPASVTNIGFMAFYHCYDLTNVTFAAGSQLKNIGGQAFECAGLTSITIPASVTRIEWGAFRDCSSLTNVTFEPGSQLKKVGDSAFLQCPLTGITLPEGLTYIELFAFGGCTNLTEITIPVSVTNVEKCAFVQCSKLEEVTVLATEPPMAGQRLFSANGDTDDPIATLKAIKVPEKTVRAYRAADGWRTYKALITDGTAATLEADFEFDPATGTITDYTGVRVDVVIPSTIDGVEVKAIDTRAFRSDSSLTSVSIPAGVTNINKSAFSSCSSLTNVTFAAGSQLRSIESEAFYSCKKLVNVSFPAECPLETIGDSAFHMSGLTGITIPAGVTNIEINAFYFCGNLASVTFAPDSKLETIGRNAFNGAGLTSITIPASVTNIGNEAFRDCKKLESVTFASDSRLESIVESAFRESGLTSIMIPASVTKMDKAFMYCRSLTNVTFAPGSQLKIIGASSFLECPLTGITFPEGLTDIGQGAFGMCTNLTEILIPAGVTNIGMVAFAMCSKLEEVTVLATEPPQAGVLLFSATGGEDPIATLKAIKVPAGSVDKYKEAEATGWSAYATYIQAIPEPAAAGIQKLDFTLKAFKATQFGTVTMADGETLGDDETWVWAVLGSYTSDAAKSAWATLNAMVGKPIGTGNLLQVTSELDAASFGTSAASPFDINVNINQKTVALVRAAKADGTIRAIGGVRNAGKLEADWTHENELLGEGLVSVAYYAWDSEAKKLVLQPEVQAIQVTDETTVLKDDKWYLVSGDWTFNQDIAVSESAHLILWPRASVNLPGLDIAADAALSVYTMWDPDKQYVDLEIGVLNCSGAQVGAGACFNVHGCAARWDKMNLDTINVYGGLLYANELDGAPAMCVGSALNVYGGEARVDGSNSGLGIVGGSVGAAVNVYGGMLHAGGGLDTPGIDVGSGASQVSLTLGEGVHVWVADGASGMKTEATNYAKSRERLVWVTDCDLIRVQDFTVARNESTFRVKTPNEPGEGYCWAVITLQIPYSTGAAEQLMAQCNQMLQSRSLLNGIGTPLAAVTAKLDAKSLPYSVEYHTGDTFDLDNANADMMLVCRVTDTDWHYVYTMGGTTGLQAMSAEETKENALDDGMEPEPETVSATYYAWNGEAVTGPLTTNAIPVTAEMTELGSGWYVVQGQVAIDRSGITDVELRKPGLKVNGDVHLILADGAELVMTGSEFCAGVEVSVVESVTNSLTIYGQVGQTGKLTANGGRSAAGIGGSRWSSDGSSKGSCGAVTINGGVVTAKGGLTAPGIGNAADGDAGCLVVINAGTVAAIGGGALGEGMGGAGIGGAGYGSRSKAGGTVIINGGDVTARGDIMAAGIGGGYTGKGGDVTINGGIVRAVCYGEFSGIVGGAGTGIGGGLMGAGGTVTINGGEVIAISHPLDMGSGKGVFYGEGIGAGAVEPNDAPLNPGTLDLTGYAGVKIFAGMDTNGVDATEVQAGDFETWHTNLYVHIMAGSPVPATVETTYCDWNGTGLTELLTTNAIPVTAEMTELGSGWYVVQDTVVIDRSGITDVELRKPGLKVNGDVHLILADGAELVVTGAMGCAGIEVNVAESVTNSLTIYGQKGQTGKLTATGRVGAAGLGGSREQPCGTVTINGGVVETTGGQIAPGIGTGRKYSGQEVGLLVINAGTVTATAGAPTSEGTSAGIGGAADSRVGITVIINGGTVSATGGALSAGIGGGMMAAGGDVTINGGMVRAVSYGEYIGIIGGSGAGIGGGAMAAGGAVTINGGEVIAISYAFDYPGTRVFYGDGIGAGMSMDSPFSPGTLDLTGYAGVKIFAGMDTNGVYVTEVQAGDFETWHTNCYVHIMAGSPAPEGSPENPWNVAAPDSAGPVTAYTNGTGTVIVEGTGTPKTFTEGEEPWAGAEPAITQIIVPTGRGPEFKAAWPALADKITDGTVPVEYYAWNGVGVAGPLTTNAIPVTAEMTELGSGWYVVNSVVSNFTGIVVKGDAHLILADGAELYANGSGTDQDDETDAAGICVNVDEGGVTNSISIYGQANNTGKLIAIGGFYGAGIGSQCPLEYRYFGFVPVDCGVITIHGGDISASSGEGSGIGGFCFEGISGVYGGTITIYGGKVEAMGVRCGTGIGSGGYSMEVDSDAPSCRVTIYGGEITAEGAEAGIGGGIGRNGGIVTIYDGTVNSTSGQGAGIGGGEGAGGDVAIYGGNITAQSLEGGAGIGSGVGGAGGSVAIHGGTVRARSYIGAGIGNGMMGAGCTVTITGGDVEAISESVAWEDDGEIETYPAGAGIGGGLMGAGGTVTVSGGEVTAISYPVDMGEGFGVVQSDGIGAGYNLMDPTTPLDPGTLNLNGYTGYIYAGMDTNGVEVTEVAAGDFATVWHTNCYVQITQTKRQDPALADYEFDPETGTIIKYKGAGGDVTIPAAIGEVAVRVVGEEAFGDCSSLTTLTIPASVTNIEFGAINGCAQLTRVMFAEGSQLESIGKAAFMMNDALKEIEIPASVKTIGETAFASCWNITNLTFEAGSRLETIGECAFRDCSSLTTLTIPASVTNLVQGAFFGCDSLSKVMVAAAEPPTAGEEVFADCDALEKIYVPYGKKAAYVANEGWAEYADLIVEIPNYLAFTGAGEYGGTVSLSGTANSENPQLETAFDVFGQWTPLAISEYKISGMIELPPGKTVYFRRRDPMPVMNFSTIEYCWQFAIEGAVAASGNVMSLLDKTCQQTAVGNRAFASLFSFKEGLVSAPELPATELAQECYSGMFSGCESLTNAPALPATTLAIGCYGSMFSGCKALTDAPELSATTLPAYSCSSMFVECSSLTNVPRLAVREFGQVSALGMFGYAEKLNALTVEFDSWPNEATENWLLGVAETGVFTCPIELPVIKDVSHIPEGWVVKKRFTLPGPTAAGSYVVSNALGQVVEPIETVPGGNLYEVPVAGADDTISIYAKPAAGYVVHGQNPLMINLTEGGEMGELPVAELPATVTIVSAKSARTEGAWSGAAQVVYELHNLHEGRNYALEFDLTAAGQFGSCTTNLPSAVVDGVYTQDVNRVEFFGPESQVEDPAAELTLKLIEK